MKMTTASTIREALENAYATGRIVLIRFRAGGTVQGQIGKLEYNQDDGGLRLVIDTSWTLSAYKVSSVDEPHTLYLSRDAIDVVEIHRAVDDMPVLSCSRHGAVGCSCGKDIPCPECGCLKPPGAICCGKVIP